MLDLEQMFSFMLTIRSATVFPAWATGPIGTARPRAAAAPPHHLPNLRRWLFIRRPSRVETRPIPVSARARTWFLLERMGLVRTSGRTIKKCSWYAPSPRFQQFHANAADLRPFDAGRRQSRTDRHGRVWRKGRMRFDPPRAVRMSEPAWFACVWLVQLCEAKCAQALKGTAGAQWYSDMHDSPAGYKTLVAFRGTVERGGRPSRNGAAAPATLLTRRSPVRP